MRDLLPMSGTPTLRERTEQEAVRSRYHSVLHSTSLESARLDFEWLVTFTHPETLTESEAKSAFERLMAESARAVCHLIIHNVPDEVVSVVLPQLEELADYELRMWHIRREVEGPDIAERWISLPLST